ncbi:Ig-like domain-containing protein [Exiguobacterium sp. SH5S13]|uniref:Ig-like domain-containing protein n=1 Tax=Exiguobacterium sp. SH5S13 TaxID=2510959 RepID=UPI0013764948|nr:Ig-like domain-containing protein [Exiguobacterium sp. SH5S13]
MSYTIAPGEYTVGDTVPVEVVVKDNVTEQNRVYLYLKKPKSGNSLNVWLTYAGDGRYQGELTIAEGMEAGVYHLNYISAIDDQGNAYTLWGDDKGQSITMFDTNEDVSPPEILSYTIAPGEYTIGDTVPVEVVVKDNVTEQNRVYLYLKKPKSGNSLNVWLTYVGDGRYQGELTIAEGMEAGVYHLNYISAIDDQGNAHTLWGDDKGQSITMFDTNEDTSPPEILSYTIAPGEYTVGDAVPVEVVVKDNVTEQNRVYLYLKKPKSGNSLNVWLTYVGDGRYQGELMLTEGMEAGVYHLHYISAIDDQSNSYTLWGTDDYDFSFRYPSTDTVAPTFKRIDATNTQLDEGEATSFTVFATDDLKLKSVDAVFVNGEESITLSSSNVTNEGFQFDLNRSDFPEGAGTWKLKELTIADLNQNTTTVSDGLVFTVTTLPKIEPVDEVIVNADDWWSYTTVNQDVYIMPGATLTLGQNTVLNGNVYVGGRLRLTGGVQAKREIRASSFTFGHYYPYQDGMVTMSGSNSISSMIATSNLYGTLPFRLNETPVFETNGNVAVAGAFIPLGTLYVNGEAVQANANGTFRLDMETPGDHALRFAMTDQFGKTHRWTYKVYTRDLPVVSVSKESGIYLRGETAELTATKQATVYYAKNDEAASPYTGAIPLSETMSLTAYAVDEIELTSENVTRRYEVFHVDDVTNRDTSIRGKAEPGTELTLTLGQLPVVTTAKTDGTFAFTGLDLTTDSFTIQATRGLLTSDVYTKKIRDVLPPVVSGVENGKSVSTPATITFNEGTATLNGKPFTSGQTVDQDGKYTLLVRDASGNETTLQFTIDQTAPVVTGVTDQALINKAVTVAFNEGTATLNGKPFTGGAVTKAGTYVLRVTDLAGNETALTFTIDLIAPAIEGVDAAFYQDGVTPTFTEGMATLNGKPYTPGIRITTEGTYTLVVTDAAGNETMREFTIDRTPVAVTGVADGVTKDIVTPRFTEGTATLNGKPFTSGQAITGDGAYTLVVTDAAGNETTRAFTIDRTAPIVTGATNGTFNKAVIPVFTDKATLNGRDFTSGTTVTNEGTYTLVVTDLAGNKTEIRFTIDQTKVEVSGVEAGKTYVSVTPRFTEGKATLNGASFVSGQTVSTDGDYTLSVTDEAGNETVIRFTVDATPPAVIGLNKGQTHYREVAPTFAEGTATLNGQPFASGTRISREGAYTLRLVDASGNETTETFTIDRTRPAITGVTANQLTKQTVTIRFNEGTATLNGKVFRTNTQVSASGNYTLRVTDVAGNYSWLAFTIDKVGPTKPTILTLTNKSTRVTGRTEARATVLITYGGRTYTTKASSTGVYAYNLKTTKPGATVSVRGRDAAGNVSSLTSTKVLNTFTTFTTNPVKSTQTIVTGKGNRAATVQAYVGTKAISKAVKVDAKGNYRLMIPKQKTGTVITVKMTQTGYQEVKKTNKVVR